MAEYAGLESLVNIYFFPSLEGSKSSRFPADMFEVIFSGDIAAIAIGEMLASSNMDTSNNGVVVLFL